jgi:site-specific DNA-methyltransferase (adenine-specific)
MTLATSAPLLPDDAGQGLGGQTVASLEPCTSARRIEIIGDATLYLADCRDILPGLPKVDLIVSDVPYRLESGGNTTGEMGGKFAKGTYDNSGSIITADIEFDEFMPLLAPLLDQGHAYFMVNNRHVGGIENAAIAAGFRFHNWLVWDKVSPTPNRWYMKNCEFTLLVFRGLAVPINDCSQKQLIKAPNVKNGDHDTEKPVALMAHYIKNSSDAGDTVLDPFMGSGTTGVAALQLGRKFIGIEIEEKHFETSCRRIESALKQGNLL